MAMQMVEIFTLLALDMAFYVGKLLSQENLLFTLSICASMIKIFQLIKKIWHFLLELRIQICVIRPFARRVAKNVKLKS